METPKPRLVAVLAHPDDESFGMGGTLALYARRGAEVHLVCATRGEAGDVDPQHLHGYTSIAELRQAELQCAAGKLGLAGVHFLGYRDSGMPGSPDNQHPQALAAQPLEKVAAQVAAYLRDLRPQVVLTFDSIGGYHHPDHIAIHRATLRAFELAGDPAFTSQHPPYQPQKLYFHLMPRGWLRFGVRLLKLLGKDPRRFGRNQDINLEAIAAESDFPMHARIDYRKVMESKEAAALCHQSQADGATLRRTPLAILQRLAWHSDVFMRAYPAPNGGAQERDLFAGLEVAWPPAQGRSPVS
ncbi:MAG: PIG-L family deacetylase [Anaerolineales bacterium]|nr:PIG-L family deacetylase [Anaerolineales bacterium]